MLGWAGVTHSPCCHAHGLMAASLSPSFLCGLVFKSFLPDWKRGGLWERGKAFRDSGSAVLQLMGLAFQRCLCGIQSQPLE